MIDTANPEIRFALRAVREAAMLVREVQQEMVTPALTKADRSPVTVADFASQAVIARLLSEAFPDDVLVAEEDAAELRTDAGRINLERVTGFVQRRIPNAAPGAVCEWIDYGAGESGSRFWTLDPIDGTKGFLRGDQYAVALALVVDGRVTLGVLGCPQLRDADHPLQGGPGSLLVGAAGQGAWTTALDSPGGYTQLGVSATSNPARARILRSVESGHTNISQVDLFARSLGVEADPLRLDSQAKYAMLAAGKGDLYLRLLSSSRPDYKEKIWDQAAGSIILEEAGGMITDLDGRRLDFTHGRSLEENRGILASNRLLHESALEALNQVGA